MGVFTKSICHGLLLMAMAFRIQSTDLGSPIEFVTISNNASVKFGGGLTPTDFPIVEYSDSWYKPLQTVNFTVYTRTRRCQLQLPVSENITQIEVESIWELTDTRVYIVWNIFELSTRPGSSELTVSFITKITPVNVKTCENMNSIAIPWDSSNEKNFVKIVPYIDGFDIISSINLTTSHTKYNIDGYQIGNSLPFSVDGVLCDIQPALIWSRHMLFGITKNHNDYKLMLTTPDGQTFNRQIFEFKADQLITRVGQDGIVDYTICWSNFNTNETTTVNCLQYGVFGYEILREQKIFSGHKKLLDVQVLEKGGFLLSTLNDDGNRLEVTVFRPDREETTTTFELRSAVHTGFKKIVEFNETNGDITFAYLHYSNFQSRVILRKYHLSNWRE